METQYPKLPEDFKQRWVAALRSGEYKQGNFELYNQYTGLFCCLGVAGCVAGASLKAMDLSGVLDSRISSEIPAPLIGFNELTYELTHLNDGLGKSFSEIADWIEQNL